MERCNEEWNSTSSILEYYLPSVNLSLVLQVNIENEILQLINLNFLFFIELTQIEV